ncbi:class I SAM-dependent methyltransferase [Bradyrhizobium sp. LHD-71]|uniref:class I SAM-dependent methyltransferase n=1 Tax=Bradyrhizobium sp. LHD-71 TaxID=3072141 RepID=UPI00280FDDE2|nr:class I SAM-dependent methyltransferase [Bradyrhizobium sp. LHD-71]MDQ8727649.1 class I SAM-dependent methyltransferase [Bradyrhizobium sp. LHD-71]
MISLSRILAQTLPPLPRWRAQVLLSTIRSLHQRANPVERNCNICGLNDLFRPIGWPLRPEAMCPQCGSLERHRLLKLWLDENRECIAGKRILHFAPEAAISKLVRPLAKEYVTADIARGRDLQLNIEKIDLPDESYDVILCSHILEHVDDRAALAEIHRVLVGGGVALLMIPVVEGWANTYENLAITEPNEREIHFGQEDHVRYFGSDFRDRIRRAGFDLEEFTAEGAIVVKHGLLRGEKLFIAARR